MKKHTILINTQRFALRMTNDNGKKPPYRRGKEFHFYLCRILRRNGGIFMANFIPKQYRKDPITIRLTPEKLESVDRAAADFHMSRSEFINQCIDFALDHMKKS